MSSGAPSSRRESRSATIRAFIVDDHPVVREGLKRIATSDPGIEVCGEASSGDGALDAIDDDFDVLILDLTLPDRSGFDVLTRFQAARPDTPVLILSMESEDEFAIRALRCGAAGYLEKRSAPDRLVTAIRRMAEGHKYLSPELAERLIVNGRKRRAADQLHDLLSPREFEVFIALASGKGVGRIASELGLSVKTVNNHRANLLAKLQLKSTADLVRYALRHQLVR